MVITEIRDAAVEFLTHQIESGFEGHPSRLYGFSGERTPGLHLSDVLQDLYIRLNKPKRRTEDPDAGGPELLWTLGLGWEHILSWAWSQVFPDQGDRIVHMGEFQKDGMWMTPDRVDTIWPGIVEMKCTFKSVRKWPLSEQWYYLTQGKAYCYALGFNQCRYYIMHVMDLLGMYGGGPVKPKAWEVQFTDGELVRNWEMIINHRDLMVREGKIRG